MGQAERAFAPTRSSTAAYGLDGAAAAAFAAVARERAPGLAAAYGRLWRKATGRIGKAPWGAPWPERWARPLGWGHAARLAFGGLGALDPRLAGRARALWWRRRVRRAAGPPPRCEATDTPGWAQAEAGGPLVRVRFDGSAQAAVTLAHELGHGAFMMRGWFGPSVAPPSRIAAETGAFLAEHAFRTAWAAEDPTAGAGRWAEDHLALLVRHPVRAAWEEAGAAGADPAEAWPALANAYAPALAWAPTPPALGSPAALTLIYAAAYALALAASRAGAALSAWVDLGPCATLEALALLADLPLEEKRSYYRAYDLAEADLNHAARLE